MVISDKALIGVAVFVLAGVGTVYSVRSSNDLEPPACVADQDSICPSQKWIDALDKNDKLGKAIVAGIPKGYTYDRNQGKFIKLPPPPPPPPPPAVMQPAPQAKK